MVAAATTRTGRNAIALVLAVTGVRDDGYHLLRSVFLRLALHDRLSETIVELNNANARLRKQAITDTVTVQVGGAPVSLMATLVATVTGCGRLQD